MKAKISSQTEEYIMMLISSNIIDRVDVIHSRLHEAGIPEIEGNRFAITQLISSLCSDHHYQKPIAFVGAGASAGLYPLWQELLEDLATIACDQGFATTAAKQDWIDLGRNDPPGAAKMVMNELGEAEFRSFMTSRFGRKSSSNGCYFTRAHAEIILTSFKAFATTNYDPGLLEARIRLRSDCSATGFCTRLDRDRLALWLDGSFFAHESCPVFYAHGLINDSASWVLTTDQNDEAYADRLFIQVMEKLWTTERLVCVGFSFQDPWIKLLAGRLTRELMQNSAKGMPHFALIGYREGLERPEARNRRYWGEQFGARAIYYPVHKVNANWSDHSALEIILGAIRETCACSCAQNALMPKWT